jgi:nucleoside-diphosphate-sugar epimerase
VRVFLAGATGVIGRRLLGLLVGQDHQVTALTRDAARVGSLLAAGADAVVADVYDRDGLAKAVGDAAPDVVLHQLTDLRSGDLRANATLRTVGTRNLVDAALAAGARRVVAQSIAWVYEGGDEPAAEETPLDLGAPEPRRTTVEGVAALEAAVHEAPEWVVLRYGMLYGPGTWFAPGGLRAEDAHAGRLAADDAVTSFVHVDDAAAAALDALAWPSGVVNVCDDEPAPAREWVPVFCRTVDAPPPAVGPAGDRAPWARGADNRHAREQLGWLPRYPTWRDGFSVP